MNNIFITGLLLLLSVSISYFMHPVAAAEETSDLKTAYALSASGKYAEAGELFQKAVNGPAKSNALAHYYLATCLMELGKNSDAYAEYRTCLELNPPAMIASYCHRALETVPHASGTTSTTTSGSTTGATAGGTSRKARDQAAMSTTTASLDPADRDFVKIHQRTPDTEQIFNAVVVALALLPRDIKDDIKAGGCKILICPTILDANPQLLHEQPPGYSDGGAYDNCPARFQYDDKTLYIAERYQRRNSPPGLNLMAGSFTLHELGHAYDFVKGHITDSPEFQKLYRNDYRRVTNSQRTRWGYYCMEGGGQRGRSELFAELFAIKYGAAGGFNRDRAELTNVFPQCAEFVKRLATQP